MSLILPSSANDYFITAETKLDPSTLNAILGSIAGRLKSLQTVATAWDDALIEKSTVLATAILEQSVLPYFNQVAANVTAIQGLIVVAQDQLAALQAGGVEAENVPLADTPFFPANTNAQQAFMILADALDDLTTSLGSQLTSLANSLGNRMTEVESKAEPILVTANANVLGGRTYRVTSAAAITMTLPNAPTIGQTIRFIDGGTISAAVKHTIARNGKNIQGKAENLVMNVRGVMFSLWFNGSEWRLF